MFKTLLIIILGLAIGILLGLFFLIGISPSSKFHNPISEAENILGIKKTQIVGFLPYWLLDKADKDYSKYLTQLSYFGLAVDTDGTIKKLNSPQEEEIGWYDLHSGKVDNFFSQAKKNNINLSLLVFNGDEKSIYKLIDDPIPHAQNLIKEVTPLMKKYGFTDLNLDIESVNPASDEAREKFTTFAREIKKGLDNNALGTLTIDASPIVLVKNYLINLTEVGKIADYIVLMTYDYHYAGSYVTGPVSPIGGMGEEAEFDIESALKEAVKVMHPQMILLGTPLYGYEWETIGDTPRSPVIPGSGLAASNRRVEQFLSACGTCSAKLDSSAKELYLIYKDQDTGTYHQIFFPDENATKDKIDLAKKYKLGGLALWALGYEGDNILLPLQSFK